MLRTVILAALTLVCVASNAEARPKNRAKPAQVECFIFCPAPDSVSAKNAHTQRIEKYKQKRVRTNWTKPRAWCGWWMRKHLGVANPAGNRARWWASFGSRASGPAVGVLVVFARGKRGGHVGIITGRASNGQWVLLSGNDGNAVRERPRSLRGAIAYRWPSGALASRGQAL